MPELPEVEIICQGLKDHILHKTIEGVNVLLPESVVAPEGMDLAGTLPCRAVESISRRGKYLILDVSKGLSLVIHLRMSGNLIYHQGERDKTEVSKHARVVFSFAEGELHFTDVRKFGRIELMDTLSVEGVLEKLGPEPLDETFEFDDLGVRLFSHKKTSIKAALMNQAVVAGIGNIYADEILFAAGIKPNRMVEDLKTSDIIMIHEAMRDILKQSIAAKGTTFRDHHDAEGNEGSYQDKLKVYGRIGKLCVICNNKIMKEKIAGRSSAYCPVCQK